MAATRTEDRERNATPLLLFPCNGNAIEALDCVASAYRPIGFIDDSPDKLGRKVEGLPVLPRHALQEFATAEVLAVPGGPQSYAARREIVASLGLEKDRFARVVHPRASVSAQARLGRNVLVMAGVVLTSNACVGDHVCILPNSVVHHDAVIGDWTLVGANVTIAGGCVVGENCYVGSGSSLMNGVHVGDGALIGLGSTVVRDVAPGAVVAGNPARRLR